MSEIILSTMAFRRKDDAFSFMERRGKAAVVCPPRASFIDPLRQNMIDPLR